MHFKTPPEGTFSHQTENESYVAGVLSRVSRKLSVGALPLGFVNDSLGEGSRPRHSIQAVHGGGGGSQLVQAFLGHREALSTSTSTV